MNSRKHSWQHTSKWLLIPVEIKAREFESRLLLSAFAAENGYGVIIGEQGRLIRELPRLPRGIYFDKSIAKNKSERFKQFSEMGFILVSNDEEGLASHNNRNVYLNQRISEETLDTVALFFTWGREEGELIKEHFPVDPAKISASGNPRVDLWRPEFRGIFSSTAGEYKSRYGKYVLVPTNFTSNHVRGVEFVIKRAEKFGTFVDEESKKSYLGTIEYLERTKEALAAALPTLASALPYHRVIIRPHPSESHQYWEDLSSAYPSVDVVFEGAISPWILGADCLIHSSCTTGLEAYLMDVPTVSYLPFTDNPYIEHISNKVSTVVHGREDFKEAVRAIIDGQKARQPKANGPLTYNISSLTGPLACEKILSALTNASGPEDSLDYQPGFDVREWSMEKAIRICDSMGIMRRRIEYGRQKFSRTSVGEVQGVLKSFQQVSGKFEHLQVAQLNQNLFTIVKSVG